MKHLRFLSKQEAMSVLSDDSYKVDEQGNKIPWDGTTTPFDSSNGNLAVFIPVDTIIMCQWSRDENRQYNENGEPDFSAYSVNGYHVNIYLSEESSKYDAFEIQVNNPANKLA